MQEVILITEDMHRKALAEVRSQAPVGAAGRLFSPISSPSRSFLEELWDQVEGGLTQAAKGLTDLAQASFKQVVEQLSQLAQTAQAKAEEVRQMLLARLNDYLGKLVDACLSLVRSSVVAGGKTLSLTKVSIGQTLKLSGSLEASLTKIAEFVAEGEVGLTTEYA